MVEPMASIKYAAKSTAFSESIFFEPFHNLKRRRRIRLSEYGIPLQNTRFSKHDV